MNWPPVVRRRAQIEIANATIWYEQRQVGLGRTSDAVKSRPESFPVDFQTARRASLRRFPYSVFHLTQNGSVLVIAFLHGSQSRDDHLAGRI